MRIQKITLSLLATTTLVFANSYNNHNMYNNNNSNTHTEYVPVVHVEPIYENINQKIPFEECWDEKVPSSRASNNIIENNIGTLLGGIAGGILGHQIGGGSGKTVATIGGAILGSAVGNNLSNSQKAYRAYEYETVRRCRTNYRYDNRRELSGYNNVGYYKGQKIVKFSNQKLRTIPVTLTLNY